MKIILDECLGKSICVGNSDFINSVDAVGRGASDKQVWKLLEKTDSILATDDQKFMLHALRNNKPVWDYKNGRLITPVIDNDLKYSDVLTHYTQKTGNIVIP